MMISGSVPSLSPAYPPTDSGRAAASRNAEGAEESRDNTRPRSSGTDKPQGLEDAELKILAELKARDREVRAHEAAHQAVGGQYAGSISYVYERGPDGAQYAVGGEVSIDTSPIQGDPQATIEKMRTVRSAALAPAEPSPQDRAVAAEAMQLMLQAQSELSSELGGREGTDLAGSADGDEPVDQKSRGAANTYQTVSGFDENVAANGESTSRFMATA
ncbi:putative metalloprotease CJM1_0395 family protein [Marinobacter sp. ATCH36]|uniref:putative metalloprotease CJM1_0395 family protein n=1 Tax=Marinobacter sp. ATCH36 TaxID=2945106 RepID=UPI0020220942|nr:putative metalloprotease CJM1_0395 family protein [Marinobacter sp. ATCH36]MCL7946057.1 hypothetical protein [Marinobacter sp. ATCH36]